MRSESDVERARRLDSSAPRPPQPIAAAPRRPQHRVLLYCPEQGGWHTGEWRGGGWLDSKTLTQELEPSHWTEVPPEPDA